MSNTGLEVLDKTLQTTNLWLDDIMQEIGPDRHVAWKVLSVVLHKLRDRLPVELAAHLGAQLPLLVRGVYYDQYQPSRQPTDWKRMDGFAEEVGRWLSDIRPVDPRAAIGAVLRVLSHHLPDGQVVKVRNALPHEVQTFWHSQVQVSEPG
jgi:uncharacterized protein (DUF2267 family)